MAESSQESSTPDFGTNQWLVEEMYDRYQEDPKSVDASWVTFFENGGTPSGNGRPEAKTEPAPAKAEPEPAKSEPAPAKAQSEAKQAEPKHAAPKEEAPKQAAPKDEAPQKSAPAEP